MTPGGRRTGDDLRVAPTARTVRADVPGQEGERVGRAGINPASYGERGKDSSLVLAEDK